jgi:hypothetical protein
MSVLALVGLAISAAPVITPSPGQGLDLGTVCEGDFAEIYITISYDDPYAPLEFYIQFNSQSASGWDDLGQVTAGDWVLTVYLDPEGKTDLYVKVTDLKTKTDSNILDFTYTVVDCRGKGKMGRIGGVGKGKGKIGKGPSRNVYGQKKAVKGK